MTQRLGTTFCQLGIALVRSFRRSETFDKYLFNCDIGIVGKYGPQVQALLKKAAGLDIATICPLHGPVLTENLGYYINLYDIWSSYGVESEGIVIAYTSVYGNTKAAVELLAAELEAKGWTREQIDNVLQTQFVGSIEQVPPSYSACKINGKRAYKIARTGNEVELKAKTLVINEIELLEFEGQRLVIRVVCGKGTYIRALARDIGLALGSGAHLTGLRRTRVGDVLVQECLSVDEAVDVINTTEIVEPETA